MKWMKLADDHSQRWVLLLAMFHLCFHSLQYSRTSPPLAINVPCCLCHHSFAPWPNMFMSAGRTSSPSYTAIPKINSSRICERSSVAHLSAPSNALSQLHLRKEGSVHGVLCSRRGVLQPILRFGDSVLADGWTPLPSSRWTEWVMALWLLYLTEGKCHSLILL
jgi:hypothetical protein